MSTSTRIIIRALSKKCKGFWIYILKYNFDPIRSDPIRSDPIRSDWTHNGGWAQSLSGRQLFFFLLFFRAVLSAWRGCECVACVARDDGVACVARISERIPPMGTPNFWRGPFCEGVNLARYRNLCYNHNQTSIIQRLESGSPVTAGAGVLGSIPSARPINESIV